MSKTRDMWDGVVEVEDKYILPYAAKVDAYVNSTHEYELGVYKHEVDTLMADGKVSKEDVPYMEFLENMPPITKDMIPDTSLMWEFVERPKKKD
jgi:hypothetical protein